MTSYLPVLQYGSDDTADEVQSYEQHEQCRTEPQVQQQADPNSKSSSSHSGKGQAADAKRGDRNAKKPKQQPDDSNKPDVMQELAKERKRRAFIGMLKLLEQGAKDASELQLLVAPMSDTELLLVAEERSLAHKCGNPLCSKPFEQLVASKYRVTAGELHAVEPLEGDYFCSKSCGSFTQQLAAQLVNPMERIKPSAMQKALAKPSHSAKRQGVAAQGGGVATMKAVIEERPAYQLIHEAEAAGQQLDEAAAAVGGNSTSAAVVEGYVPRQAPLKQPRTHQQQQPQQQGNKQQQQGSSRADDSNGEVLQLNPVLNTPSKQQQQQQQQEVLAIADVAGGRQKEHAPASGNSAAAAGAVKGPSADSSVGGTSTADVGPSGAAGAVNDLQQYLQVFREHQEHTMKQLQQQQHHAEPSSNTSSSSHHHDTAEKQTVQQQQQPAAQQAQQQQKDAAASSSSQSASIPEQQQQQHASTSQAQRPPLQQQQRQSSEKRVRFAPDVAYTCPAQPELTQQQQQQQEQPVLTFTLQGGSSSSDPAGSSSGDGALVGELQLATVAESDSGEAAAAAAAGDASDASEGDAADGDEQQQVPEAWKLFLPPALGGVGVSVKQVVIKPQAHSNTAKLPRRQRQQQQQQQEEPLQQQRPGPASAVSNGNSSRPAAKAAPTASSTAAAADASSAAGGGGKPRRFSPFVRQRRSVVVLDEVPGVTVRHRGVQPGATAAANSSSSQQAGDAPGAAAASAAEQSGQDPQAADAAGGSIKRAQANGSSVHGSSNGLQAHGGRAGSSSGNKSQVVRIGPLRDHTNSSTSNGLGSAAAGGAWALQQQHDSSSDSDGESESEGSEMSSQDEWHYEASSSSRANARQQRSKQKAAEEGDGWDSGSDMGDDGEEAAAVGIDEDGSDGEGSEDSGADGLAAKSAANALDSWLPFFDTKGVTVHLSEFGLIWNHLHAWVSPATQAYVSDRHAGHTGITSSSSGAGGGNGSISVPAAAGQADSSSDVQRTTSMAVAQQRVALVNLLAVAVPPVLQQLDVSVPEAQLSKHLSALVRSFYMAGPLPALQAHQWQLLVTLLLAALSAWQLPVLRPLFKRDQQAGSKLAVLLQQLGSDVDRFWALMDLFELQV